MNYFFTKDTDAKGRHIVHMESCGFQSGQTEKIFIGYFNNGKEAVAKAQKAHPRMVFEGCFWCCPECHTD